MITVLNILLIPAKIIFFLAVLAIVAVGFDLLLGEISEKARTVNTLRENKIKAEAKIKLRKEKEDAARLTYDQGGFFEESYDRGFGQDGRLITRGRHAAGSANYKKLDDLNDTLTALFLDSKEL